jgi:hypothetical protein
MRLTVLSGSAALAVMVTLGAGTPALSQSLPTFAWTGFYAGLNAGANLGSVEDTREKHSQAR